MRAVNPTFVTGNAARNRRPRLAVQIVFDVSSPTLTSQSGIANLPGTEIQGVIDDVSSISQQIFPEEGRATIGQLTIKLIDGGSPTNFTDELREQLTYDAGSRDREIRVFVGFTDDFNDFERVGTFFVDNVSYLDGVYTVTARDKSKALRQDIFQRKRTNIATAATATDTSIVVASVTGFQRVKHGASFSDAPNSTVGYLLVPDSGEIIRYTGINVGTNTFTGCTRGVFRTRARPITFEATDAVDTRPAIEEFIYLEMPAPAVALALLTGVLDVYESPAPKTPDHWNLGLTLADLDLTSWLTIGVDLWNPADLTVGLPVRFTHLDTTDGKQFVEQEVFALAGVFAPVNATGVLTLRRMTRILVASPFDRVLNESNIIKHGELKFDQAAVTNQYRIDYNYDGDELTRSVFFQDNDSISIHGPAPVRTFEFRGMHSAVHTQRLVAERFGMLRDRYASPPMRLSVTVTPDLNALELGDLVLVDLPGLQDWTDTTSGVGHLQRTFEIQKTSINWTTGDVSLDLVASSRVPNDIGQNPTTAAALDDDWYSSAGTNMASWAEITAGVMTGTKAITGADDANAAGSIFYYLGNLTISGTINVTKQAQFRIRGFLTINGTINGAGLGRAGVADPDTVGGTSTGWTRPGVQGAFGPSRAGDGLYWFRATDSTDYVANINGATTETPTRAKTLPRLNLIVSALGELPSPVLPAALYGCSGGPGGQVIKRVFASGGSPQVYPTPGSAGLVGAKGGTGGASGSGLAIICRGLGFGVNGVINLSGVAGSAGNGSIPGGLSIALDLPTNGDTLIVFPMRSGYGAGGAPGALYVLLDGDGLLYPDLGGGAFLATQGLTRKGATDGSSYNAIGTRDAPNTSTRYPFLVWDETAGADGRGVDQSPVRFVQGLEANNIPAANYWVAASQIQYLMAPNDTAEVIAAPADVAAETGLGFVRLTWTAVQARPNDRYEIFAATVNDRAFAVEVGEVAAREFIHWLPNGGTRYYWVRTITDTARRSNFTPITSTAGVQGVAGVSGLEVVILASPASNWVGDDGTSPITWTPSGTAITITCTVTQFGILLAQEILTITLSLAGQNMTWAYASGGNAASITTTATSTPANTITFTFAHTSGVTRSTSITSIVGGGVGPPGPQGDPGTNGTNGAAGAAGLNQATVYAYQRTTTSTAPASLPSATCTYEFATAALTGLNNGWTTTVPAFSGSNHYLWLTIAPAVATTATDTIGSAEWSTARLLSQNGADGTNGTNGSTGATGPQGAPGSLTLAIRLNKVTFSTTRNNNLYVHGFDGTGTPSGTANGSIAFDGAVRTINYGTLLASQESLNDSWIVFDTSLAGAFDRNGSSLNGGVANYNLALVKRYRGNVYKFDAAADNTWTTFTPTAGMVVIGSYTKTGAGASTGQITSGASTGGGMSLGVIPIEDAATVKAGDLATGSINSTAPFASSLAPVGLYYGTLPTNASSTTPRLAVLVDDTPLPRLYRLVSISPTVWTRATNGADIVADSIVGAALTAGAITAREIATDAITAVKILAETITAAKLVAGTLTAREIAVGGITADRIQVGGFNLVNDPGFEFSSAPWSTGWNRTDANVTIQTTSVYGGAKAAQVVASTLGVEKRIWSTPFPCRPADVFAISARVRMPTAGDYYPLVVFYFDAALALIGTPTQLIASAGGGSAFGSFATSVTVPAGAYYMAIGSTNIGTGTSTTMYVDDYRAVPITTNALVATGAISADKLAALIVLASTITTASGTADRVIIDNTTVPIWVGTGAKSRANAKLQFDTATDELYISGAIQAGGTITAAVLAVPVLDASATGTLTIRTDSSNSYLAPLNINQTLINNNRSLVPTGSELLIFDSLSVYHPQGSLTGFIGSRLQSIGEFIVYDYSVLLENITGTDRVITLRLRCSFDNWATSINLDNLSLTIGANSTRFATLSKTYQIMRASGWDQLKFRLYVDAASSGTAVYISGGRAGLRCDNLGYLTGSGGSSVLT